MQTKVIHQTIPDDLLPHFVMPVWYPGGGNEAFVDYIERTEERARKHNATIDAAREANQERNDTGGVSKP